MKNRLTALLTPEFVVSAVLAILCLASYAWQAFAPPSAASPREAALFNALQFILTVAFAWFSTRAVSRREFEGSLKRFAVSAYRRASDIEQMIKRLQSRVMNLRADRVNRGTDCSDLDIIGAVIDDHLQVVSSSLADWSDVIGDELLALEKVRLLEAQKAEIHLGPAGTLEATSLERKVSEIDKKIADLVATLPAALQFDVARQDEQYQARAVEWFAMEHQRQSGLLLRVVSGGQYSDGDAANLTPKDILGIRELGEQGLDVFDSSGTLMGRVLNLSPLTYKSFKHAFKACFGDDLVPVRFVELTSVRTKQDLTLKWFTLRVTAESRVDVKRRKNRHNKPV